MSDHSEPAEYASPPCFMHELSPDYRLEPAIPPAWPAVAQWRRAERRRLIDERMTLTVAERHVRSDRIARQLDLLVGRFAGCIVGAYWPFRGEPDLRNWSIEVAERGGRIALPVVIRKGWPLEYRIWTPGDRLERGAGGILAPSHGPAIQPDVVVAPVVGFDERKHRLGYGGGFFDRTLAAMPRKPLAIGVGYAGSAVTTIYPQPHDIAMDVIVTD